MKKYIPNGIMLGHHLCPDVRLFYFCRQQNSPSGQTTRASRSRPLLFFVQRGKGSFETAAGHFDAAAGDVFCLFPEKGIRWHYDEQEPMESLTVEMMGSGIEETLHGLGFTREDPLFHSPEPQKSIAFIEEQSDALYRNMDRPLFLQQTLFTLLNYLGELRIRRESTGEVEQAKSYIRTNFRQPITVTGIAEMVSLSRSHFSRLFTKETGMSPQEYLLEQRLIATKQLLRESKLGLEQIALLSGFRSAASFSKTFCRKEGCSPTDYRKRF